MRLEIIGWERKVVAEQDGRANRKARALASFVIAVRQQERNARGQAHGKHLLNFLDAALDLLGESVSQAEHQERAQRGGHQVGEEELEWRKLQDTGGEIGRRAEADGESAENQ